MRKCPYCDFYSLPGTPVGESGYIDRLKGELTAYRHLLHHDSRHLSSIFFGGGTPSLLKPTSIQTILETIHNLWNLTSDCEITLEANPDSCQTPEKWQEFGINRVSLGVQAMNDSRLKQLGRPHDLAMAKTALDKLKLAGFKRINLDLIYATPNHSLEAWRQELEMLLEWDVDHLSCYELTLEPDTPMAKFRLPDDNIGADLFEFTRQFLQKYGFQPYEISNYARPGQACRHNVNYWEFGDYLGIGAAAHGKWTDHEGRIWRSEHPRTLTTAPLPSPRLVSTDEAGKECLLMGLRQQQGVSLAIYKHTTGEDLLATKADTIKSLQANDWLIVDSERLRITASGMVLADEIMMRLL
ncbi:MAG: radical SAM family heme chaperone HemW [Magnetococcales bacterium]|nr:radical SAM family heme chaperone HemW [Magnetococcales bacterium]